MINVIKLKKTISYILYGHRAINFAEDRIFLVSTIKYTFKNVDKRK